MNPSQATQILIDQIKCNDRGDIVHDSSGSASCYCHRFGMLTPIAQADVETRSCLACQGSEWPAECGQHDKPATRRMLTSELSKRARTQPERKSDARDVTLCCVDCVNPDLAAFALDMSRRGAEFSRVLLLSHQKPSVLPDGIEFQRLPSKMDKDGYNLFMLQMLCSYLDTTHVVTIQTDGWLLRPELFDRRWLEYDYIGAPWSKERWHAGRSLVGNSGCCLRSKELLHLTAVLADEKLIRKECRGEIYDDVVTCYVLHDKLAELGMSFADPNTAADFAIELSTRHGQFIGETCGYHGRRHAPTRWLEQELPAWKARTKWQERGGILRLCVNPYFQNDMRRQEELDDCFLSNVEDGYFDEIVQITCRDIPPFDAYVHALETSTTIDNAISVFCNSDVYFDESIVDLCQLGENDFACLTRHEKDGDSWRLWEECGHRSQDAWAYRGKCKIPLDKLARIKPGMPGVDNHIAWLAREAGYRVVNPSRDVRVYHLHADQSRRPGIEKERVSPPYLHVWPHHFGEESRTEVIGENEYIGPGASAVYHPIRREPWNLHQQSIQVSDSSADKRSEDAMIYLSIDVNEPNGEIWHQLQEHCGAVVMYPHELNVDDICIVEATLGSEFIPNHSGRGLVICAFMHDYHLRRGETGERQWNIIIHRIETCLVGCHRVVVPNESLAGVARKVIQRNRIDALVDVVGDWVEYVSRITMLGLHHMQHCQG